MLIKSCHDYLQPLSIYPTHYKKREDDLIALLSNVLSFIHPLR